MGATRNTGYIENIIAYDASNNVGISGAVDALYKVTLGGNTKISGNLKVTGTITFDSNVTANSFVKADGLSSQFLKADGTVDGTTYQTSFSNQNANTVYAGPTTGAAAAPTFRTLVAADIPSHNQAWSTITSTPTTISGYGITDAYTKTEVDGFLQGLNPKASVRVATTANITLSGEQTIDGIAVVAGNRVLVKNQGTGSANGIYVASASGWSRADDASTSAEMKSAYVFVEEGTELKDTAWVCTTDSINLGTTALTFIQFAGPGAYQSVLNGTGFVKASGTTITYDNSTYVDTSTNQSIGGNKTFLNQLNVQPVSSTTTTFNVIASINSSSANPVVANFGTSWIPNANNQTFSGVYITAANPSNPSGYTGLTTYALQTSGNVKISGTILATSSITGNSIVKTGGTASQFLKADGSVDSSTYLTAEADTLQSVIGRGNSSNTGITITNANDTYSTPASTNVPHIYIYNTGTTSTANAVLSLRTNSATGGDPILSWDIGAVIGWSMGIDNSDNDILKIARSWSSLDTDTRFSLTQAGTLRLHAYTTNGFLKFTNSDGTIAVDTNTYLTSYTETDTLATVTGRGASTSTNLTFNGTLTMGTGGTQYIRMGRFPSSTTNSGEAWIGRASDRGAGTMTVQLGTANTEYFEVVDYAWSKVILRAGMNDFVYKDNVVLHAGNYGSYAWDRSPAELASTNLNDMTTTGYYWSATQYASNTNIPYSNYFTMINMIGGSGRRAQLWFSDTYSTQGGVWWRPRQGDSTGWHAWEKFLTSVNYNDYAPTKTGGGASGTWSISITGNSATTSQTSFSNLTSTGELNTANIIYNNFSASRHYAVDFDNASNQKVNFEFDPGVWGYFELHATCGYNYANRPGLVKVGYYVGLNPGGAVYANERRVIDSGGPTGGGITFSDITWTGSKYRIVIANRDNARNLYKIKLVCFMDSEGARNTLMSSSMSAVYTSDTTSYAYPYPYYNVGVGFGGKTNPSYAVDVSGVIAATQSNGPVAIITKSGSAPGNNYTMRVVNTYGNHSWGITGEFRVENNGGSDRPSILFSSGYNTHTWSVGFGGASDSNFRINRDHGYINSDWGVTLMNMDRSGNVTFSGDVTAYSDIRLKENIKLIENPLEKILQINGVTFTRNDDIDENVGRIHTGVIAQEVLKVLPEVVSKSTTGYYQVAYGNMVGLLIEAIKEQQKQIEELKSQIKKQ